MSNSPFSGWKSGDKLNAVTGVGASGRVAFWNAADVIDSDSVFVWDGTNKRLGIGTPSPVDKLTVNSGKLRLESSDARYTTIEQETGGNLRLTASVGGFRFNTASGEVAVILGNGNICIGTTTDGMTAAGSLAIAQDLAHRGTKAGFFNVTPVTRPSAYTQTYSTASKTVPNATASNPPAGGTGATAGAYDTAANRNAMITSLTNCIADVLALKNVVTAIIDDLQALGILQ